MCCRVVSARGMGLCPIYANPSRPGVACSRRQSPRSCLLSFRAVKAGSVARGAVVPVSEARADATRSGARFISRTLKRIRGWQCLDCLGSGLSLDRSVACYECGGSGWVARGFRA